MAYEEPRVMTLRSRSEPSSLHKQLLYILGQDYDRRGQYIFRLLPAAQMKSEIAAELREAEQRVLDAEQARSYSRLCSAESVRDAKKRALEEARAVF